MIDQAIHYLDVIRWLVPSPVEYVEASCASRMHSFIDVEDSAEGVIKFENGFYACFYLINFYSYDDDPEIEIDCEKARVNIVKDSARILYYRSNRIEKAAPKPHEYIDYGDGVRDYWGIPVVRISDFTGAPEILGGRVKTLHPVTLSGITTLVRLRQ